MGGADGLGEGGGESDLGKGAWFSFASLRRRLASFCALLSGVLESCATVGESSMGADGVGHTDRDAVGALTAMHTIYTL